jgi:hypothetical protein
MRLINDVDERLFQTVTAAARMGRTERLLPTLMAEYDEQWDEPEAGFRYALALVALIQAEGSEREKRARYTQSMEALDDVIEGDPGHWLARYCRARNRVLIRTGYGRYPEYLGEERDEAAADIGELLRVQQQVSWRPYFAAASVLAAQLHAALGEPEHAAELVDAAAVPPREPIPYPALRSILSEPFLILYHGAVPPAKKPVLATMTAELFPGDPAIQSMVRADAVG